MKGCRTQQEKKAASRWAELRREDTRKQESRCGRSAIKESTHEARRRRERGEANDGEGGL